MSYKNKIESRNESEPGAIQQKRLLNQQNSLQYHVPTRNISLKSTPRKISKQDVGG